MPDLTRDQRRPLEATMKSARDLAEAGAADALRRLGGADARFPAHLDEPARAQRLRLRLRLREHARGLGDKRNADGTQDSARLHDALAEGPVLPRL